MGPGPDTHVEHHRGLGALRHLFSEDPVGVGNQVKTGKSFDIPSKSFQESHALLAQKPPRSNSSRWETLFVKPGDAQHSAEHSMEEHSSAQYSTAQCKSQQQPH